MPEKKESVAELKKQLASLQDKVATIEGGHKTQERVEEHHSFEVKTLYSWDSPERLFIPRNRKWFTYTFLIILIITVVLLFAQEYIIIAPIAAIGFISYVLATVPPHKIGHKLTTEGINSGGRSYLWNEMSDFWLTKKGEETLINIETYLNYPRRLIMLLGEGDLEKIKEIMVQFIPYREIPKTNWLEKTLDSITERFHKFAS